MITKKVISTDGALELYCSNGIDNYAPNDKSITVTNAVVGNGVVLDNGDMTWDAVILTSYIYTFGAVDDLGITHYAYSDGVSYKNGEVTLDALPLSITTTGISGITGTINKIAIFNEVKSKDYITLDYENELRFW